MNIKLFAEQIVALLDDKKAEEIVLLPVREMTTVADYMIVATCGSGQQVRALADYVHDEAKKAGVQILGVEGAENNEWVLIDLGAVIVHLMQPEIRHYYELEKLWTPRGRHGEG